MTPFPEADEFRALLDALCEDRITPAQLARLEELVLTRPEAEAYYVQYLGLYAELANTFSVPPNSAEQVLRSFLGASPDAALHSSQRVSQRTDRRPGRLFGRMAAAVVVAALITAGWSLLGRRPAPGPGDTLVAVDETVPLQDPGAERFSNTVALMRDSSSARWAADTRPIESGSTISPGRLRLDAGLVEIEFYSGTTVVLEGPADFQIVSSMEAFCSRGKLRATVPPHAKGFTIGTPRLDLVDRGTEFGMRVDGSAATEVHVFEGKVDLYRSGSDPRKVSPDRELTTGQAVRIEGAASTDTIASDSGAFVSSEELSARTRAAARGRQREWEFRRDVRLRQPGLAIYYTFEPQDEWPRTLKNQVGGESLSADGTIVGCNWGPGRWPGKRALEFRQVSDRVRLNLPGQFDAVTVAMWASIEALPNRFNSLLMSDSWESSEGHWHISNQRTIQLGVRGTGGNSSARYTSPKGLDPEFLGRWTHFALVYDRAERKVTHYVNGQVFCELPLVLDVPLRFGDTELGNWSPGNVTSFPERFLTGRIDEFLLYTSALSPQDVKELANEIEARE